MDEWDTSLPVDWHLGAGEQVLWSGRPPGGLLLRGADVFLVPFSLVWAAGVLNFSCGISRVNNAPMMFSLVGAFFTAVAAYMTFGRFWIDTMRRDGTRYAVTNQRVIIRSGILRPGFTSLSLRNLGVVSLREGTDGTGSITFGASGAPFSSMYEGTAWPGVRQPTQFERIPGARRVHDIILEAQKAS